MTQVRNSRSLSRRLFLALSAGAFGLQLPGWAEAGAPTLLDHILLGCNDLDQGIAYVERHTGVRAALGGVHPGRGTRNALLSLGTRRYLEIIAPDPQQSQTLDPRHLVSLKEPRLVGWAAHPGDLAQFAAHLRQAGIPFEGPTPGSRKLPDGSMLRWSTLNLADDRGGLLPFFIQWGADSTHPSATAPRGCALERFALASPDPSELTTLCAQLNLEVGLEKSTRIHLEARIGAQNGKLELTS